MILHCIKQASMTGGKNTVADGYNAAKRLQERSPEDYRLLTRYKVPFYDFAEETHKIHTMARHHVIRYLHKHLKASCPFVLLFGSDSGSRQT